MIHVIAVGKVKAPHYRSAIEDYERRIQRLGGVSIVEIPDRDPEWEGEKLLRDAKGSPIVACDPRGEDWSSEDMAAFLGAHGAPCFLLGGPEGLSPQVQAAADRRVKLSSMTFPHELARLVLVEQLYRGLTIQRGHPYHR